MFRRFIRFAGRAALIVAIGVAVATVVQRIRRMVAESAPPARDPWPPIARVEPVAERPAPAAVPDDPVSEPQEAVATEPEGGTEQPLAADAGGQHWVPPIGPAECPESHPVKVKLSSKLYHLPGMLAYTRTHPDRCYDTEESAIADGFTRAKR